MLYCVNISVRLFHSNNKKVANYNVTISNYSQSIILRNEMDQIVVSYKEWEIHDLESIGLSILLQIV